MPETDLPATLHDRAALPGYVLDSLNAGVYVTDPERRIVYWNRAAERITGWRAEDILGRACSDQVLCHVDKDNRPLCGREFCPLHRAITTGRPSHVPSVVYALSSKGGRIPMRVSVAPLHDEAGGVIGGVETFFDMSSEIGDLRRAQRIQQQCIINEAAGDGRLAARIHYAPCDMIGGDFCTVSRTGEDRYAFILADVTGHGLSAALYTMYLRSLWDELCEQASPAEILRAINRRLAGVMTDGGTFATAVCGVLELDTSRLALACAGGPTPLLADERGCRPAGELSGLPMGLVDLEDYEQTDLAFVPGQRLLLFSDGAEEIGNRDGKQLGSRGLAALLGGLGYPGAALDFAELEQRMLSYSDAIRFADDVTFLELGRP